MDPKFNKAIRIFAVLVIAFFVLQILTGCAPSGGSGGGSGGGTGNNGITCGTLQGAYYAQMDPSITMTVSGSCTFTDSVCGYQANYTVPDYQTGATVVTIINTNGAPGCMSNTSHACTMGYNGVQLSINCDSGAHQFLFVRQ